MVKTTSKISLDTLARGAFVEKFNSALSEIAENIQNPNTEAAAKRGITITIKFSPNKNRQMVNTQIAISTKLAPAEAIDTELVVGTNVKNGTVEFAEYDSGDQMSIYDMENDKEFGGDESDETVEESEKLIILKKKAVQA